MSYLTFDPTIDDFLVMPENVTLRDFYIAARKDAGIRISKLQTDTGLNHPQLANVERPGSNGKCSNAPRPMLAALETLGFRLELVG